MPKTYHNLKSISCRKCAVTMKMTSLPPMDFVILYNESKISFDDVQRMISDDSYKTSNDIMILSKEESERICDL